MLPIHHLDDDLRGPSVRGVYRLLALISFIGELVWGTQDQVCEDIQVRALHDFGRKIDFAREPDLVAPLIKVTSSTGRVRIRKLPS